MNVKLGELPEHIRRLNPHLFVGGVEKSLTEPNLKEALDRGRKAQKRGSQSLVISLVRYGRRKLDDDNLAGGFKPLRDAIARSLDVDDGDPRLRWEYGQIETHGQEGVAVKIQTL